MISTKAKRTSAQQRSYKASEDARMPADSAKSPTAGKPSWLNGIRSRF